MPQVTPLGLLRPFFTDKCGKLLVGGKVFTYEANSLTPKITYADSDGLMPNTNPIILDKSGEADIYLDGNYRFQIFNRFGVLIHDINNIRDHFKDQIQNFFTGNILAAGGLPENSSADYNYLMQRLAQIAVDKGWDASSVTTASNQNQQEINDFGGAKWWNKPGGYKLGATVKLANGDIVKSTVANNIVDPNVNMTGWFNTKDKSYIGLSNVDNTSDINKPVSNATNLAIIAATQNKATNQELIAAVSPKADITYVDDAVGAISTDASKQYATLALANADIANIALNKNIFVSEAANGGYWYKATAGATSLTKSPYDPLTQAKLYADSTKVSKDDIQTSEFVFAFSDSLGNLVATIDKDGLLKVTDVENVDGYTLAKIKHYVDSKTDNSLISTLLADGVNFGIVDTLGNFIARIDVNGDVFLPKINRPLHKEIERLNNLKEFSINFSLAAPNLNTDALQRLKNLQNKANSQKYPVSSRKRVSTYKDGGTTIQRIPVLFQIEPNRALCMFNRGIVGFDGDLRGVDTYQCFIAWDSQYQVTNVTTPTLMYSVQNELVGGSAKHATICRLANNDLYVMFDVRTENLPHAYYEQRYMTSSDNGLTWSPAQPVIYNNTFLSPAEIDSNISFVMGSCGQIITLPSGRLVTPMYTTTEALRRAFIIYSDDQGATWSVSNWIGGSLGQGGDGVSLGEPNIVRLNSGKILIYMKSIAPINGYKVLAHSDNDGETIVLDGNKTIKGVECEAAITKFSDDTLIMTLPTNQTARRDFRATFSIDAGENFNLIQHREIPANVYGGYSSVIPLNDEALLIAVEGITAIELGGGESIDVYSINLKEVLENGVSY